MRRVLVAALCLTAGCVQQLMAMRPVPTPAYDRDPPHPDWPDGVDRVGHWWIAGGDVELYAQSWRKRDGQARAAVVVVHGLDQQSDHYTVFAGRLAQAGYATYGLDLRGHGRSEGQRGEVEPFALYLDDLASLLAEVRRREPGVPIFLFGAGVGGALVSLYAIERSPAVAGIVLEGPTLIVPVSPLVLALSGASWFGWRGRDDQVLAGLARLWAQADQLTAPLLIVHGADDRQAAPAGSHDLVARATSRDRTLALYPALRHHLLHRKGGAEVTDDILAWLDARAGGAAIDVVELPATSGPPGRFTGTAQLGLGVEHQDGPGTPLGPMADAAVHLTWGRPGWLGGARYQLGLHGTSQSLYLLGGFVPVRGVGLVGLTAGVGYRPYFGTVIPAELVVEVPVGSLRAIARVELAWEVITEIEHDGLMGVADTATGFLGARLGGDRRYWRDVHAGHGLYGGVTVQAIGEDHIWGVQLGGHLSGSR